MSGIGNDFTRGRPYIRNGLASYSVGGYCLCAHCSTPCSGMVTIVIKYTVYPLVYML